MSCPSPSQIFSVSLIFNPFSQFSASFTINLPLSIFLSFPHSIFLSFLHSIFLSFSHSIFYLSFTLSFFLPFPHSIFLSFLHSIFLSLTLSFSQFITLSFFPSLSLRISFFSLLVSSPLFALPFRYPYVLKFLYFLDI